jgi:ankyrin repeat protein
MQHNSIDVDDDASLLCIKQLIKNGANPELLDHKGRSLLHYACYYNNNAVVKFLLYNNTGSDASNQSNGDEDGDLDAEDDEDGSTGRISPKVALQAWKRIQLIDQNGESPLHAAIASRATDEDSIDIVLELCRVAQAAGKLPQLLSWASLQQKQTALHLAAAHRKFYCFRAMDMPANSSSSSSSSAASGKSAIDFSLTDKWGRTYAHYFARGSSPEQEDAFLWLMDEKASQCLPLVRKTDALTKRNGVHYIALGGTCRMLEVLHRKMGPKLTASLRVGDINGLTPLHLATRQGNIPIMEWLMTAHGGKGGLPFARDRPLMDWQGNQPLHYAAYAGQEGALQYLLDIEQQLQQLQGNDSKSTT